MDKAEAPWTNIVSFGLRMPSWCTRTSFLRDWPIGLGGPGNAVGSHNEVTRSKVIADNSAANTFLGLLHLRLREYHRRRCRAGSEF